MNIADGRFVIATEQSPGGDVSLYIVANGGEPTSTKVPGNNGGHSIAVFDKDGKPLTPPEGITFGARLGLMQGIIVAPNGDVWALGASKSQLVYFPKGDLTKGRIVCEGASEEPCKSFLGPFRLAIDQQDRIWVANAFAEHVTRFPAADPSKAETFYAGASPAGLNIELRYDPLP